MRIVVVKDGMPKRENFKLKALFEEFIALNVKIVKLDFDEGDYKSPDVARSVIGVSAKRHCYPVKAALRSGEVYLIRTDM